MQPIDTLITARWVIPIEPAGCVLHDHAVAIHHGRIVAVEPAAAALGRFAAQERIDRPAHVVLPGFINAHTRAANTLLRGAAESASFEVWLHGQVRPLEQRWADAEYVRDGTELAIADMLTSGTTCFADQNVFPEVIAQTASALRMRACVGLPVLETPGAWAGSAGECLDKGLRLHDEYRDDPLITTALAPLELPGLDDASLIRVRRAADELELPMAVRLDPSAAAQSAGERPLTRLERLGLLSPLLAAVHAVDLDDADADRLAGAGASVVHCPQADLKLGLGVCPVPRLKARGINVALGTDSAACNNDLSMLDEVRSGALLARGLFPRSHRVTAHQWLEAVTLGGARALGLGDQTGSLLPGKWADLCCIDLSAAHTQPVYDPAAQIIFAASRDQVSDVWVAGRVLLRDAQLIHLDLADVLRRAQRWGERILGSSKSS